MNNDMFATEGEKTKEPSIEIGTRSTRKLLQSIQRFHKSTLMITLARIIKTMRLVHVNLLIKKAIKEGILDIQ
jgi:hypothetical protein